MTAALAAVAVVGWTVTTLAFLRSLNSARREHARREDLLVNQICSLAGKPWLPPPADEGWTMPEPETPEWVTDPEQALA